MDITFGSLFSGGGGLDLGLERAGLKCAFQVENDRHCLTLLERHWPDVPKNEIRPCVGLVGGDPCPVRSRASAMHGTTKPDMSGHFLAMAARCKPRWVLRENVPASDVREFTRAMEVLGYRTCVVLMDSKAFSGQSRKREFVAGFDSEEALDRYVRACQNAPMDKMSCKKNGIETTPLLCLNTRRARMDCRENYVFEGPKLGIRFLSFAERESLQGWPVGWTDGVPNKARERITGNGVTAPVAEWIGKRIIEANREVVLSFEC